MILIRLLHVMLRKEFFYQLFQMYHVQITMQLQTISLPSLPRSHKEKFLNLTLLLETTGVKMLEFTNSQWEQLETRLRLVTPLFTPVKMLEFTNSQWEQLETRLRL